MRPHRTFLFMPGNRQRMLDKGPTTGADALLPDLEDAVPVEEKAAARAMVREYIPTVEGPSVYVRINSVATGLARDDLEAVVLPGLEGVFVPKVESPDEVHQVVSWFDELEGPAGIERGTLVIVAMLETANAVRIGYEIASASPRVVSLCYSGAENGDLQTDLGVDWSVEGTEMLYARSKIVLDARAAGLDRPIEGVYAGLDDIEGLVADTTLSKRLGYKGRAIIHPRHVDPVNRIYAPQPDEIEYYHGLLGAFDDALADGKASVAYRGKMIDYAMAERARRVLALAEELGLDGPAGSDRAEG